MPNYVKNIIHFRREFDMDAFNERYVHEDGEGNQHLDFNDLIPMPEGIRESESSTTAADWSRKHWGTKRNAMETYSSDNGPGDKSVEFQTAWNHPGPVVEELSRHLPGEMMLVEWSDEDEGGGNCGAYLIQDGAVLTAWKPSGEQDCIDFGEYVWFEHEYEDFELGLMYRILRPVKD